MFLLLERGSLRRECRALEQYIVAKAKCHLLLGLLRVLGTSSNDPMLLKLTCKILDMMFSKDKKGSKTERKIETRDEFCGQRGTKARQDAIKARKKKGKLEL